MLWNLIQVPLSTSSCVAFEGLLVIALDEGLFMIGGVGVLSTCEALAGGVLISSGNFFSGLLAVVAFGDFDGCSFFPRPRPRPRPRARPRPRFVGAPSFLVAVACSSSGLDGNFSPSSGVLTVAAAGLLSFFSGRSGVLISGVGALVWLADGGLGCSCPVTVRASGVSLLRTIWLTMIEVCISKCMDEQSGVTRLKLEKGCVNLMMATLVCQLACWEVL